MSGKKKSCYIGSPAIFQLEQACSLINSSFGGFGCYLVGSAIERPNFRDVDVRYIMKDIDFAALFPNAEDHWEQDPRWLLLTVSISKWLSAITELPIDFQFQQQTHANVRHSKPRHAIGLRAASQTRGE